MNFLFKYFLIIFPLYLVVFGQSIKSEDLKKTEDNSNEEKERIFDPIEGDEYSKNIKDLTDWEPLNHLKNKAKKFTESKENKKFKFLPKEINKQNTINNLTVINSDQLQDETMSIKRQGYIRIDGPKITLSFKDANAKDALIGLAEKGGYSFLYVPEIQENDNDKKEQERLITLSFINEDYEEIINSIILAAGWEGKKEGNVLIVGQNILSKGFQPEISKIYKMNNASASSAADYLASLGAVINKVSVSNVGTDIESQIATSSAQETQVQSYGSSQGPLKGLIGTTDSRRETITIIGKKELINLAEKYLKQIDVKQKQVAMSIKILDVNIDKNNDFKNSFATMLRGNPSAYIISDEGNFDLALGSIDSWTIGRATGVSTLDLSQSAKFDFVNWLKAKITSKNTKVLASPTLILSESRNAIDGGQEVVANQSGFSSSTIGRPFGNESFITVGTKVITNFSVTAGSDGVPPSCEATFGNAGLTFGAKLHKVDSKDFVSFSLSPELSAVTSTRTVGNCGSVNILSVRRLDTGTVRVKSGNTLVLTGVVSDTDTKIISKWPIIGDIPLIGNLFKTTSDGKQKNELIILVTPQIIPEVN